MNLDSDITLDLLESGRTERQQLQQDLSEAQELSRIREAQIKEELNCISSFQQQLQAKEQENRRLREVIEKAPLPSSSGAVFEKFGDPKQWMGEYIEWWLLRQKALVDKTNA